jgi:hypothetical protein
MLVEPPLPPFPADGGGLLCSASELEEQCVVPSARSPRIKRWRTVAFMLQWLPARQTTRAAGAKHLCETDSRLPEDGDAGSGALG